MIDIKREREAETQAEGEAGSMSGARCGTRSGVSRVPPRAEGGPKLPRHPGCPLCAFLKTKLAFQKLGSRKPVTLYIPR